MVNKGTRLTIYAEGATTTNYWGNPLGFRPEALQTGVYDVLAKKFTVHSVSVMPRSSIALGWLGWPYRAEVIVTTSVAYASADDAASIVANAFYQIGGSVPAACVDGYGPCDIKPAVDESKKPSQIGWMTFALIALVAVTATGVFVAKRG
jgi:hypothetical protein